MSKKRIRSAQFPNVYLRIDGRGVDHAVAPGAGVVNCQFGAGPWETHDIVTQPDGSVAIGSTVFPNVFLRLDGAGLTRPVAPGGGVANCQYTAMPYEKFRLAPQPNGSVAIASVQFPGVFLRMDGTGVTQPAEAGGGVVNGQFTAGPWEQFIIENADPAPSMDYLSYFFLRNKGAGGLVLGFAPTGTTVVPQSMLAHGRGPQLFKCVAVSPESQFVLLVNQATDLALQADGDGSVRFAPADPTAASQQWAFTAQDQIVNATQGANVLVVRDGALAFAAPDDADAAQKFEMFYPSDFVYVRNCWTGRFLTAALDGSVSWQLMTASLADNQQWGVTADGLLVNRGTDKVLQLTASTPVSGASMVQAQQAPLGAGNANQRFVVTSVDGKIHCAADPNFVIGAAGAGVVSVPYGEADHTQLIEFISPFQFFSIQNQAFDGGYQCWLTRNGGRAQLLRYYTGAPEQLFTISRYGEVISPIDGFVMQSQGSLAVPLFVDPAPDPIGFDTTTFVYDAVRARYPGTGGIFLRSGEMGLLSNLAKTGSEPAMYEWFQFPISGNQAWALIGPQDSLFSTYQDLARSFFANPAPLPSTAVTADVSLEATANEKTVRVILAIVTGLLGLVGVSVGSVTWSAAGRVAQIVLGDAITAARIAVIMQGVVTAASIIAVADGITRAGLWLKIVQAVLPNSFWGWVLTAAKLGATIAGFAVGVGWAVKGAQVAFMVADVVRILKGVAAAEVRILADGVAAAEA